MSLCRWEGEDVKSPAYPGEDHEHAREPYPSPGLEHGRTNCTPTAASAGGRQQPESLLRREGGVREGRGGRASRRTRAGGTGAGTPDPRDTEGVPLYSCVKIANQLISRAPSGYQST